MIDFLSGLAQAGQAAGAISSIGQLLGMGKDRISNRDYMFYQDLADSGNPREIKRQGDFLTGLAPSQAAAYNKYQDATYNADTMRHASRVQTMADELGMSPWEITGASGAAPLPSPGPAPTRNDTSSQFMQNAIPLEVAKINAKTSIANAMIQSETAKDVAATQTASAQHISSQQTASGMLPVEQAEKLRAEVINLGTQNDAATNQIFLSILTTLFNMMPKETVKFGDVYTATQTPGWKNLAEVYARLKLPPGRETDQEQLARAIQSLPTQDYNDIRKLLMGTANDLARGAQGAVDIGKDFLKGLGFK